MDNSDAPTASATAARTFPFTMSDTFAGTAALEGGGGVPGGSSGLFGGMMSTPVMAGAAGGLALLIIVVIVFIVRRVARGRQQSSGERPEELDLLEPESLELTPELTGDTQYYLTEANVLADDGLIGEDIGEGGSDN
jgi:hypothetical protein